MSELMFGEETDETTLFGAEKHSYVIPVLRPCDGDACALLSLMIQIEVPSCARVPSLSVTT